MSSLKRKGQKLQQKKAKAHTVSHLRNTPIRNTGIATHVRQLRRCIHWDWHRWHTHNNDCWHAQFTHFGRGHVCALRMAHSTHTTTAGMRNSLISGQDMCAHCAWHTAHTRWLLACATVLLFATSVLPITSVFMNTHDDCCQFFYQLLPYFSVSCLPCCPVYTRQNICTFVCISSSRFPRLSL
jgi:hypothetical protein